LIFGLHNKYQAQTAFKEALNTKGLEYKRFSTRPTPLNTILWACNVEAEDKYYLAYFRIGEGSNDIAFYKKEKNHHLSHYIREEEEFKTLRKITKDNYIMREDSLGNLIMSDLRFGQHDGFLNGEGAFVFEYIFLLDSEKKIINVIQKRNSVENGGEMLKQLWNRII
jgi:inner membrane protein